MCIRKSSKKIYPTMMMKKKKMINMINDIEKQEKIRRKRNPDVKSQEIYKSQFLAIILFFYNLS